MSRKVFVTARVLQGAARAFASEDACGRFAADGTGAKSAEGSTAPEGLRINRADHDRNGDNPPDGKAFTYAVDPVAAKTAS